MEKPPIKKESSLEETNEQMAEQLERKNELMRRFQELYGPIKKGSHLDDAEYEVSMEIGTGRDRARTLRRLEALNKVFEGFIEITQ